MWLSEGVKQIVEVEMGNNKEIQFVKLILKCPVCDRKKPMGKLICGKCEDTFGTRNEQVQESIYKKEMDLREIDKQLCGALSEMALCEV